MRKATPGLPVRESGNVENRCLKQQSIRRNETTIFRFRSEM
jgi:hypothetical protein